MPLHPTSSPADRSPDRGLSPRALEQITILLRASDAPGSQDSNRVQAVRTALAKGKSFYLNDEDAAFLVGEALAGRTPRAAQPTREDNDESDMRPAVPHMLISKFCERFDWSEAAVHRKIASREWRCGREWHVAPDRKRVLDVRGYERWAHEQREGRR